MILAPKKQKFKKSQKGKKFNKISKLILLNNLPNGIIGLRALESIRLTSKQLTAFQFILNKLLKKVGKCYLNLFPHTPISKKPIEIRMGKGKGNIDHWVAKVKAGTLICQIEARSRIGALKAIKIAKLRLPCLSKIIFSI